MGKFLMGGLGALASGTKKLGNMSVGDMKKNVGKGMGGLMETVGMGDRTVTRRESIIVGGQDGQEQIVEGVEAFYNENGDEYIGIKTQCLERFWNKLSDQDTDVGNSFHEAHFEYTLSNGLPDDEDDSTNRRVVAINDERIRCEVDIMEAHKYTKKLKFTKLSVTIGVGKHVYSDDTTHIVRHMDQMKSEQLEWFKLLQYGDAGSFYYKTNWPDVLTITGSTDSTSKGLDKDGDLNGIYRWFGNQKMHDDSGPEYPKYRHIKKNGFIDMKFQHHDHSRVWIIRNSEQVPVYSAQSDDCHLNKAPPLKGWNVHASSTEPTLYDEGTSCDTIKIKYSSQWAEKGPTSIVQLEKLYHIGKVNLDTMVREAKPNTPLEPMRKAKHPGMVELRARLEENSGPILKQDDNMLHNAVDHIPKLAQVFKRFDLSNMGFVGYEDLKGIFVEMKMSSKELIEGLQFFKMHGSMVNETDFLAWAVKYDLSHQDTADMMPPSTSNKITERSQSRAVSMEATIGGLSGPPSTPSDSASRRRSASNIPRRGRGALDVEPGTEGHEGFPESGLETPTAKNITPRPKTKRSPRGKQPGARPSSPRDKNNARLNGNRQTSIVVNA